MICYIIIQKPWDFIDLAEDFSVMANIKNKIARIRTGGGAGAPPRMLIGHTYN